MFAGLSVAGEAANSITGYTSGLVPLVDVVVTFNGAEISGSCDL